MLYIRLIYALSMGDPAESSDNMPVRREDGESVVSGKSGSRES